MFWYLESYYTTRRKITLLQHYYTIPLLYYSTTVLFYDTTLILYYSTVLLYDYTSMSCEAAQFCTFPSLG